MQKRMSNGDVTAMIKGIFKSIEKSNLRDSIDSLDTKVSDQVSNIKLLEPGTNEMKKFMVELWVQSVNSTLNYVDRFSNARNENITPEVKIDCGAFLMAKAYNSAFTQYEENNNIDMTLSADRFLQLHLEHDDNRKDLELEAFFLLIISSNVKMGELKYGTPFLIKSKTSPYTN